jgi:hypothetical protein
MKLSGFFLCAFAGVIFTAVGVFAADTNIVVTTPPVYVPDMSHASGPLPEGILVWDGITKETNVTEGTAEAHFVFSFTNISTNPVVFFKCAYILWLHDGKTATFAMDSSSRYQRPI